MLCEILLYIVSIALQLSGAILLLLNSFTDVDKQIITQYSGRETWIEHKDGKVIFDDKERVKEITKSVWLNRLAFGDLVLGYATTIIAKAEIESCRALFLMLLLTLVITLFEWAIASIIAKRKSMKNMIVDIKDLKNNPILFTDLDNNTDKSR